MKKLSKQLKKQIQTIVHDDYDECRFFTAAAHMLVNKIQDIAEDVQKQDMDFTLLRNTIGEIGMLIANTEKRLQDVEECYTKMVDAIATEKKPGR